MMADRLHVGDRVRLSFAGGSRADGAVRVASLNGRSIIVTCDDRMIGGFVGGVPLSLTDAGWQLLTGESIGVERIAGAGLPARCLFCDAVLEGERMQHQPDCDVFDMLARAVGQCVCRTCDHPAGAHVGGSCLVCGRASCWS
jgi:hypothetical protein